MPALALKSPRKAKPTRPALAVPGPEPDLAAALQRVLQLMAIPGKSCEEGPVVEFLRQQLLAGGVPGNALVIDQTHRHSPYGGTTGGLICQLPGTFTGPRRLLMAHVDTVPLCVGSRPMVRGQRARSADKTTGLGADNRAGASVVLTAVLEVLRQGLPHPPLTFFWPIQEEIGLVGARYVPLDLLGNPKLAFNWDGGDSDKLTVGATGAYRMELQVRGLASHAGGAPEQGVSAIAIASLAIAELHHGGWHGDVHKNGRHGTSNVGVIQGGVATNVVTDSVMLKAEARSHDRKFRLQIASQIEKAFKKAARAVKNIQGVCGRVKIHRQLDYESFCLKNDEPCLLAAEAAVRQIGRTPYRAISNGGLDANWLSARGLPTVTLGCGQLYPHTVREQLDIPAFQRACRIALRLATGAGSK